MAKSSNSIKPIKAKKRQGKRTKSKSVTAAKSNSARLEVALECAKIGLRVRAASRNKKRQLRLR